MKNMFSLAKKGVEMGWILEILKVIGSWMKLQLNMGDNLNQIKSTLSDYTIDLKSLRNYQDSLSGRISNIENYGSNGAMRGLNKLSTQMSDMDKRSDIRYEKLHGRISNLDDKLDSCVRDIHKAINENTIEIAKLECTVNRSNGKG